MGLTNVMLYNRGSQPLFNCVPPNEPKKNWRTASENTWNKEGRDMGKERKPSNVCDHSLNICEVKKFFLKKVVFKEKKTY
jgi:hypothetical protein